MFLSKFKFASLVAIVIFAFSFTSCGDDLESMTYEYDFNTGQVAAAFAYSGDHPTSLGASIEVVELEDGGSEITVTLDNTVDGETYATHAHDMADASTTPNGTPYNETPNSNVFAGPIVGNGGSASRTQTSTLSFDEITTSYDGFFVVHDPLQAVTTVDPTTYVMLGVFAR